MRKGIICSTLLFSVLAMPLTGMAEEHHGWHGEEHRGHEEHFFWRHEAVERHEGHWYHGVHDGRLGWWWIVAGSWLFFPRVVYPEPATPPPVVVQPQVVVTTPPPQAPAPVPPPSSTWYYCQNPKGYYPYVSNCPAGWTQVPAVPPQG